MICRTAPELIRLSGQCLHRIPRVLDEKNPYAFEGKELEFSFDYLTATCISTTLNLGLLLESGSVLVSFKQWEVLRKPSLVPESMLVSTQTPCSLLIFKNEYS